MYLRRVAEGTPMAPRGLSEGDRGAGSRDRTAPDMETQWGKVETEDDHDSGPNP